jgi:hypothetical protein
VEDLLFWINPLAYMTEEQYWTWWTWVSNLVLKGLALHLMTLSALGATFWFGAYKLRAGIGLFCFLITILCAYVHALMRLLNLGE